MFIKDHNLVTVQDAQNALKDLFAETLQEMLEAESTSIWIFLSLARDKNLYR
ncbi:hypothetical protein [Paenibacillus sp. FSL W7-1332]|uniref:hypothetical protein n=1 Tax=Paenibacillus sp. FSL W7-1332 TaxID=2921702 RepID=UPI0030CE6B22